MNDKIAKNLLLNRICTNCCFLVTALGTDDMCKKEGSFVPLPKENTCEYWWQWEDERHSY